VMSMLMLPITAMAMGLSYLTPRNLARRYRKRPG
jgi:hypothetical protein